MSHDVFENLKLNQEQVDVTDPELKDILDTKLSDQLCRFSY